MAEAMLNHLGHGRFKAYSAGSNVTDDQKPNQIALDALTKAGVSIVGLTSKSWDSFGAEGAPHMDLVITVCDAAANEACPIWPGHPALAHWSIADPALTEGSEELKVEAFRQTLHLIARRLELLINLPVQSLSKLTLQQHLMDIGNNE